MPQLQGVGGSEAAAQLCGGLEMSEWLCWSLWGLLHFVVAFAGTWLARRYALRKGLFDLPGERRSHCVATPRGGGVAIVAALLAGCLIAGLCWPPQRLFVWGFAAGLAAVALVGWCDDHRPLPASFRLVIHVFASVWLAWLAYKLNGSCLDAILVSFAAVVLINVWNFMDGIDGLATTQAMLAASAYLWVFPGYLAMAGVALLMACGGFLPFNFPKAKIFMGDAGSGALGYTLAALLGLAVIRLGLSWWWAWLPLSVFLADAGLTLLRRMLNKQRWWEPHAQHLYQMMARRVGTHSPVTLVYACFSMVAISLWLVAQTQQKWAFAIMTGWSMALSLLWLLLRSRARA
jgi:UDP-N-acetylmuramyl pentapeptide phosphotransferase/UDP-N-acetylglucosamine-1-phosphate transferase